MVDGDFACRNKGTDNGRLTAGRIEFVSQPHGGKNVYIDGFCTHEGTKVIPVRLKGLQQELLCTDGQGDLWYAEIANRVGHDVFGYKTPQAVKIANNWCRSGNILTGDINGDRIVDIICFDADRSIKVLAGYGDYKYTYMDQWGPDA